MIKIRTYPTILLALMGILDCATTVVGVLYFGAVELNPLLIGVVSSSILGFVVLKLASTILVCFIFMHAERILMNAANKVSRTFVLTKGLLKMATAGVIMFLCIVVANNFIILTTGR